MPDHFKDTQKIQELLHEAQMGLWVLELNEGKEPRMYADHTMPVSYTHLDVYKRQVYGQT